MKNILIVLGILLCLEVATRVAVKKIHFFKKIEYERVKGMLANDGNQAKILSKYLPSQYTLLSLNPEYRNEKGIRIHNALGYRGEEFPLEKEKNIYRILCLGGSTTYCSYIDNNEDTYPAILQRELNKQVRKKQFSSFPYDSVQVINAGIEGANMFLIMAQYQYKYRYFNPDMVVIHEGINDGYAYMGDVYTTDYTHLRTNIFSFKPLPVWLRGFMKSELFSMLACLSVLLRTMFLRQLPITSISFCFQNQHLRLSSNVRKQRYRLRIATRSDLILIALTPVFSTTHYIILGRCSVMNGSPIPLCAIS